VEVISASNINFRVFPSSGYNSKEKRNIKDMLEGRKSRGMNRNTLDAAWRKARTFLT
jgi:hypothetical protein